MLLCQQLKPILLCQQLKPKWYKKVFYGLIYFVSIFWNKRWKNESIYAEQGIEIWTLVQVPRSEDFKFL